MPQGMGPSQQTKRLPVRRLVSSLCTHGDHATSTFRPRIPVCSRRALRMLVGMCAHVSLWACARAGSQAHSGLKCGFAPRCDEGIRGPPRRALRERGQRPVVLPSASLQLPPSSPRSCRPRRAPPAAPVTAGPAAGGGKRSARRVCISCCSFVLSTRGEGAVPGCRQPLGKCRGGEKASRGCSDFSGCFFGVHIRAFHWTQGCSSRERPPPVTPRLL